MRTFIRIVENAGRENVIDTPAFKTWFGNSVVVDYWGDPLVVYHGTQTDFTSFRPGSHFGTAKAANARLLDRLDSRIPGDQQIMPVYLRITNPIWVYDQESQNETTLMNAIIRARQERLKPGQLARFHYIDLNVAQREGAYKAALMAGYDGLIYENEVEDRGKESWVIFHPSQVKSAIGNSRRFDPESEHIHETLLGRLHTQVEQRIK